MNIAGLQPSGATLECPFKGDNNPPQKGVRISAPQFGQDEVSFSQAASATKAKHPPGRLKKLLLAGLAGLGLLAPVGCTSDVSRMEQGLAEIPTTQTEKRLDFLKHQLNHENPKVRAKSIEHLSQSTLPKAEKYELVLKHIQDRDDRVIEAAYKLGNSLAADGSDPLPLRQKLYQALESRPYTESYTESHTEWTYHYGYNMFNGKFEFHYGPETQYETKYVQHGNALVHQEAVSQVKELLKTLK